MALVPATLTANLTAFFGGLPETEAECAQAWGDAIAPYLAGVAPPSTNQAAAKAALIAGLSGMSAPGAFAGLFASAMTAMAVSLAAGMAPPGTPPPSPIVLVLPLATDHATAAALVATTVDAWARTGLTSVGSPWS